ncbi:MAG: hypothetical protein KME59_09500 [Trichormus sp. ATA11-4-KO1]|jgi:hypothetical protein|nr:hypothetical protein [Trichormus sp. ATA11-4-KO1]
MPNFPHKPDSDSSNSPDSDSSNTTNSIFNLFSNIFTSFTISNLINNPFFAHYLKNHPFIANSLIFLIILLSGGNLYQILINNKISDLEFQTQVCQNNQKLIEEHLAIKEEASNINILPQVIVDNNSNINFLPFYCEYSIEINNKKYSEQIYLRRSPIFAEYINEAYHKNEIKMNMIDVCQHPIMKEQMKLDAKSNHFYDEKKGDIIKAGKPEILKEKTYVYPVHRWVCHYSIQRPVKGVGSHLISRHYSKIDLDLKPYCSKKASDEGRNFVEPHYHDYDNPYSFYCTDPYSRPDSREQG